MKAMYLEMREVKLQSGVLVAVLIGALGLAQPLRAAEFTCASGNVGCLIDKINQANANGQANRITLRRGTYTLTTVDNDFNGLPVITSNLTITGQAAENTIIERDTSAPPFRILLVEAAGTLTLQKLTLRNGGFPGPPVPSGAGGGILNAGVLTLIECVLTRNIADIGGGLLNLGTAAITHTTFDGNVAGHPGGGLNNDGTMTIANSTFVNNSADGPAAINNGLLSLPGNMSTLTVTNTTVANNSGFVSAIGGIAVGNNGF